MKTIAIDCGAADTRAALLVANEPVRFWLGPARGDEAHAGPEPGDVYVGRIRTAAPALKGAFVDIGADADAFFPIGNAKPPTEGALVRFKVRRPAVGGKGVMLARAEGLDSADAAPPAASVGRIAAADAGVAAVRALGEHGGVVNDAAAGAILRREFPRLRIDIGGPGFDENIEALLDASFSRAVALPGGARLVIDETEALTAVDVDTGGAAEGAGAKLNDKVNASAADRLFLEFSRRGIGGRIVVDFLPPSDAKAQGALLAALEKSREGLFECRFGRLSADGLFDLTAPRSRRSLLDEATEAFGDELRQGRRFTLDWSAKVAIRALERRLRRAPSSRPRLLVGAGIADYLAKARPQWRERLAARFGARFAIEPDPRMREREFDVVE